MPINPVLLWMLIGMLLKPLCQSIKVKTLIHGHTHRPDRHQHAKGERIVLGDWHDVGWYALWDTNGIDLKSFIIEM